MPCLIHNSKAAEIEGKIAKNQSCLFDFPDPSRTSEGIRLQAPITHAQATTIQDTATFEQFPAIYITCELDRPVFDVLLACGYIVSQQF